MNMVRDGRCITGGRAHAGVAGALQHDVVVVMLQDEERRGWENVLLSPVWDRMEGGRGGGQDGGNISTAG
jgi:hypothetical protein